MDITIADYNLCSAAGNDLKALRHSLHSQTSGLRQNDMPGCSIPTWIGKVVDIDAVDDLGAWQSRNNALAALGLAQGSLKHSVAAAIAQFGAHRVGLAMGSSTSSIDRTEQAYTDLDDKGSLKPHFIQPRVHNPNAPALFVAHMTGIQGPAMTLNTACSSSAKVFAQGARWLQTGIVDAVLVGGVDTLCLSVLQGFHSLQLVSQNPCRPFDRSRDGINLGEAAGYALLTRGGQDWQQSNVHLTGYGESSDAHHMSHPHPDGLGAKITMEGALAMAKLKPADIDYINLHGTSSKANDLIEGQLVASLFPKSTQCSSTKAWMGHTLGAAGIAEAIIAFDTFATGVLPGCLNLEQLDEGVDFSIQAENKTDTPRHVMTNSFGFGGNNCTLVFSKEVA